MPGIAVTFTWNAIAGADNYWLDVGTAVAQGNICAGPVAGTSSTCSVIPTQPGVTTIYVQLWTHKSGAWQTPNQYTYTAPAATAAMQSPTPGSQLPGIAVAFTWNPIAGADSYWLDVGTALAQGNICAGPIAGTSFTCSGIPTQPGVTTIYVQLWTHSSGVWQTPNQYTYTAPAATAAIQSPTPGSQLPGIAVTFTWNPIAGADSYWLDVGTVLAQGNICAGQIAGTSFTCSGIPTQPGVTTIYVQLWTHSSGAWRTPNQYTYTAPAPQPDFTVSISPNTPTVVAGAPASYTVTVAPVNGFTGTVSFPQPSGLPGGASATFVPPTINGSGSTTMTVNTALGGVTGTFSLIVTGISGTLRHPSPPATLLVQDFTLVLSPGFQTVAAPGSAATLTLSVGGVNGFNQQVAYRAITGDNLGPVNPFPETNQFPGTSWSFAIHPMVYPQEYVIAQVQYAAGGVSHYASAMVMVSSAGDFSISPATTQQTIAPPGSASYPLTVSYFPGSVDFSVTGLPSGVTPSFTPQPLTGGGPATMTVSAAAGAVAGTVAGTYPLTITGHNATAGSHTATVYLIISGGPDFTLTAAQSSQNIAPTGAAGYSILVNTSAGFSGTVGLSASGLPAGATASFSPASVTGAGSSLLTVATTSATPLGTFPITVSGQSGSNTHTTMVFLTVGAATPATMISPAPGSNLTTSSRTFLWNPGTGATQYQFAVGSTPGGSDYYSTTLGASVNAYCFDGTFRCQSATVNNLPIGSQPQNLYARLGSLVSGTWQFRDYSYTSAQAPPSVGSASLRPLRRVSIALRHSHTEFTEFYSLRVC